MERQKYMFSEELLKRGQQYFEKLCKCKVSLEETDLWLDSWVDFVSALTDGLNRKNYGEGIIK